MVRSDRRSSAPAPAGLERFWREIQPTLVGGLSLHTGSRAVAEELAQETLVRLWERWPEVSLMDAPASWTWRVALNLGRSRFRRLMAERRALAKLDVDVVVDHDPATAVTIRQAVAGLPERQRRALVLRYWADLSVADVARLMGCAPGTVKAHTHKAVARLREQLDVDLPLRDGPGKTDDQEVVDHA